MSDISIRVRIIGALTGAPRAGLRIEAWDKDLFFDDLVAGAETDADGRCALLFDEEHHREWLFDRRPDVFFKVFDGRRLLLDTRESVLCNLKPGAHDIVLEIPEAAAPPPPAPEEPEPAPPATTAITGRAVLSPEWEPDVLIEAFADQTLTQPLGSASAGTDGHCEIPVAELPAAVWFRWSQDEHQGRSPLLQPFRGDQPVRLHIYRRWSGPAKGQQRYRGTVRSASGNPAVGLPVALLEVSLKRCQVLGETQTIDSGSLLILYDVTQLFMDRPDLRLVVFDAAGTPLVESSAASVILPDVLTPTATLFAKVAAAFEEEGFTGDSLARFSAEDLRYLVGRTKLPAESVAAYATAASLAKEMRAPAEALFALAQIPAAPDPETALTHAVERGLVASDLLARMPEFMPALKAERTRRAAQTDLGRGSLDAFLATQVADEKVRDELAGVIFDSRQLVAVRNELAARGLDSPKARAVVDLQAITGVDVDLAKALTPRLKGKETEAGEELATLTTGEWERALTEAGEIEEVKARAVQLKKRAQEIFPEKVFREQVERQANNKASWAERIRAHYQKNPDHTYSSPLPPPPTVDVDPDEAAEWGALAQYKTIVNLSGDHHLAGALMNAGFNSASKLAGHTPTDIIARLDPSTEVDVDQVEQVRTLAIVMNRSLNVGASFLPINMRPSLCACPECKSIFGPAAYLFELLWLLQSNGVDSNLDEHRPDIRRVNLSCPNTTIEHPQPDLVNEILEDQILRPCGTYALGDGECLPSSRQSQGTSEERRATPQNQPSPRVLELLAGSSFPWTLPYDYHHDRARSARDRLISRPEEMALLVWRFGRTAAATPDPTSALAAAMLDLGPVQAELITTPRPPEDAWSAKVTGQISSANIKLADLAEVANIGYATLEDVLDTSFVGGDEVLSIVPDNFCANGEAPCLKGSPDVLRGVLDRLHRFERLRRHLGWSVRDLDEALAWLGGTLTDATLEAIGLLRFFERRLNIAPADLLTLFRDPSSDRPETMRDRPLPSAFEEQFGAGSTRPDVGKARPGEEEPVPAWAESIARATGESRAMVDLAFSEGLVAPYTRVADLIPLDKGASLPAYRRAIPATFRLSLLARKLRVDEADLPELMALSGSSPLIIAHLAAPRLRRAVEVIDLAERLEDWPVDIAELRYLIGTDPAVLREHGLSAGAVGAALADLRQQIEAARGEAQPLPAEPRAALRAILTQLLTTAAPEGMTAAEAAAPAGGLSDALAWGAFFPERAREADATLARMLPAWPGLPALPSPSDQTRRAREEAVAAVVDQLPQWLGEGPRRDDATPWPEQELEVVRTSLETAIKGRLEDPTSLATPEAALQALYRSAGAELPPDLPGLADRMLAEAIAQVEARLSGQLAERAAAILPSAQRAAQRIRSREVVAEWIVRTCAVPAASAATMLDHLLDPADGKPILTAFVDDEGGPSPALNQSAVTARYFDVSSPADPLIERTESTLTFDWSTRPPAPSLQDRRFVAELQVVVSAPPESVFIEANGRIEVEVDRDGNGLRPITLQPIFDDDSDEVRRVMAKVGPSTGQGISLRIRYTTPVRGAVRTFKVLELDTDGAFVDYRWAMLDAEVQHLHRAAFVLQTVALPPDIWPALRGATHARAIALDAIAAAAPLSTWQAVFALAALVRRVRDKAAVPLLIAFLAGRGLARADVRRVLNLEERELDGALSLLGLTDPASEPVVLPAGVGFERIWAALALVDQARRYNLPPTAPARWNEAADQEIFDWSLAGLRAGLEKPEWLSVLAEIYDPVREHLRDAQLDYLIGRSSTPTSREKISDDLFTDVQMTSCMSTSRIQFAIAAVLRYIETCRSGRLPWLPRGPEEGQQREEDFERQWVAMRLWPLYEARRRVEAYPENFIDPAIRPTKTPRFERFEQRLNSGPLSLHAIERAMKEYAASLAELARLEPIAIVTHNDVDTDRPLAWRDTEIYGTHIFARTRALPHRLYYRRILPQPDGRYTPWEPIDAELQGTHYLAVVVFGRLRLICADFSLARTIRPDDCERENDVDGSGTPAGQAAHPVYNVMLSWVDREAGGWTKVYRSKQFPITLEIAAIAPDILFQGLPRDHFRDVEVDFADAVQVQIRFGGDGVSKEDGLEGGSWIEIFLMDPEEKYSIAKIPETQAERNRGLPGSSSVKVTTRLSNIQGGLSLKTIQNVVLLWHNAGNDDANIGELVVRYGAASEDAKDLQKITYRYNLSRDSGKGAHIKEEINLRREPSSPLRGFDAPIRLRGDNHRWFRGDIQPYTVGNISADSATVDSSSEVEWQNVNLSPAITIRADELRPDSFAIYIYSVQDSHKSRIRPSFRVKTETLNEYPEVREIWGDDWVSGNGFCHNLETQEGPVATLRIYPDDTVEPAEAPAAGMGSHEGTKPVGQSLVSLSFNREAGGRPVYGDEEILATSPSEYELTVERQWRLTSRRNPKILDEKVGQPARTFLIERLGQDAARDITAGALAPPPPGLWRFHTFWHPQAIGFRRLLESRGLARLVRVENQGLSAGTDLAEEKHRVDYFLRQYRPTRYVDTSLPPNIVPGGGEDATLVWPRDIVDFSITGPFSEDNWELFFDCLLHSARRLDEDGQYDDADQIWVLLLDRTLVADPNAWDPNAWDKDKDPELYLKLYQTAPIRLAVGVEGNGLPALIDQGRLRQDLVDQFERIRNNPYQPHLIARGWPSVYARALRIHYVEHLIRAADADFRRAYAIDSRSHLEAASMRYDLAARCLGPVEEYFAEAPTEDVACFASLTDLENAEGRPQGIDVLAPYLPPNQLPTGSNEDVFAWESNRYFCRPPNDKLNELRALVAERLLNLRSCRDIDGVRRALSLYGRRIDPMLLVRATAEGLDLDVLLGRLSSARPTMYFQALWQRALQACERLRALEDSELGAQERADSEEYALLSSEQEIQLLEDGLQLASQRLDDARKMKEALDRTIESADIRYNYYSSRKRTNPQEDAEGTSLVDAGKQDALASDQSRAASAGASAPDFEVHADAGFEASGPDAGPYVRAGARSVIRVGAMLLINRHRDNAEVQSSAATAARVDAALIGRQGGFERRSDEWKHQKDLAQKDQQKLAHDLAGAEIRITIAELEIDQHKRRIDNAKALRTYMREKTTSQVFHAARAQALRPLRYQQFRITYDLVSQAKAALVREHGLDDAGLIPDPWRRDGMGAAAVLLHELEKQQQLQRETWQLAGAKRKTYSLVERDPLAFLELIQRGKTIVSITETDYDEEDAGGWFRTLTRVSIDIPAVRGPYTNVNAVLTQLKSEKRIRAPRTVDRNYGRQDASDARFRDDPVSGDFITTNSGLQDDGRLDQRPDGEIPPPFVGNGAIGTFRLELPPRQNHFDRQTISDVIIRMEYTARRPGDDVRRVAEDEVLKRRAAQPHPVMIALHSEMSNAWHQFTRTGTLDLTFDDSRIPMWLLPVGGVVQTNLYFAVASEGALELQNGMEVESFSDPADLQPEVDPLEDPHFPAPIRRLNLRQPLQLNVQRRLTFSGNHSEVKRGWLVCWVEGADPQN